MTINVIGFSKEEFNNIKTQLYYDSICIGFNYDMIINEWIKEQFAMESGTLKINSK